MTRILAVLNDVTPQERVVTDIQGNRFSMRIRPYKDLENKIDGASVVLLDIDTIKQALIAETRGQGDKGIGRQGDKETG